MRLINADALKELIWNKVYLWDIVKAIDAAPTVDAPQVVRCKDCKYWQRSKIKGNRNHDYHICLNSRHGYCIISFENDYCSRGRRAK